MTAGKGWDSQTAQIGFESTPGTPATTDTFFTMGTLEFEADSAAKQIKAKGDLFTTMNIPTKRQSTWTLSDGAPCRRHLVYLAAMNFGAPTVTQLDTGVYSYEYKVSGDVADVLTATIAFGDTEHARSVSYALCAGLTLSWNKESGDSDMAASGVASTINPNATLVENPARLAASPVLAENLTVAVAESLTSVMDTPAEVDNAYALEVEFADRFKGFGTFGAGAGYNRAVATPPAGTITLQQLNDANSRAWSDRFINSTTAYIRITEHGDTLIPEIPESVPDAGDGAAAVRETFEFVVAVQPENDPSFEDDADAYVVTTNGLIVTDGNGFTSSLRIVTDVPPLAAWTV